MVKQAPEHTEEQLVLRSRLSEIAKVFVWIEGLASRLSIPGNVRFAMCLCLEETLANIILHGYRGEENRSITVRFTIAGDRRLVFIIEDESPPFNLLDQPELPPLNPWDGRMGGQGLRLLRRFADTLEYEPLPNGNRLRIGFSVVGSASGV